MADPAPAAAPAAKPKPFKMTVAEKRVARAYIRLQRANFALQIEYARTDPALNAPTNRGQ